MCLFKSCCRCNDYFWCMRCVKNQNNFWTYTYLRWGQRYGNRLKNLMVLLCTNHYKWNFNKFNKTPTCTSLITICKWKCIIKKLVPPLLRLINWVVTIGYFLWSIPKVDHVAPIVFILVLISINIKGWFIFEIWQGGLRGLQFQLVNLFIWLG